MKFQYSPMVPIGGKTMASSLSLLLVLVGCSTSEEEEPDLSPAEAFEQEQLNSPPQRTWTGATVEIFVLERVVEDKGVDEITMGDKESPFRDAEDGDGNDKVWVTNIDFFEEGKLLVEENGEYRVDASVDYWEIGHNIDGGSGDVVTAALMNTVSEQEVDWCGPTTNASYFVAEYVDRHHDKFIKAEKDEALDHIKEYVACEDTEPSAI